MAVGFGDAAVGWSLVVARQLSLFHAVDGDEADDAVAVLKNQAGSDLVGDCGDQTTVGFGDVALGRSSVLGGSTGVGDGRAPVSRQVSGDKQKRGPQDQRHPLSHRSYSSFGRTRILCIMPRSSCNRI